MIQSDALSRREDHDVGGDTDHENMIMLPETLFIKTIDTELHDLLAETMMKDGLVKDAIEAINKGGTLPMKSTISDWKIEDGLLFFRDRCYVPQDPKLRQEIVR
jgi:hypothetical protein